MTRKLEQKSFDPSLIQQALIILQQEGLQSDARFAELYTHYRRNRGYGPLRIRTELKERGIDEQLIDHLLAIADNSWLNDALKAWKKRFKQGLPADAKSRAQQMRFLQYRGFTATHINTIFRELKTDDILFDC